VVEGVEEVEGATEALSPVPLPWALGLPTPAVLVGDTLREGLYVSSGLPLPPTPELGVKAHTPVPLTVPLREGVDITLGVENTVELALASRGVEDWEVEGVPVKDC